MALQAAEKGSVHAILSFDFAQLSERSRRERKSNKAFGSPSGHEKALWRAVACYRFRSGQLAGRRAVTVAWERSREQARGIKSGS